MMHIIREHTFPRNGGFAVELVCPRACMWNVYVKIRDET